MGVMLFERIGFAKRLDHLSRLCSVSCRYKGYNRLNQFGWADLFRLRLYLGGQSRFLVLGSVTTGMSGLVEKVECELIAHANPNRKLVGIARLYDRTVGRITDEVIPLAA
jgi:hypothetical protein